MNKKWKLLFSILMLAISIFMAISYHQKIQIGEADRLNQVAYYVWLIFIPVWTIVTSIQVFQLLKKKNS